jgi:hypothetical protein
LRAPEKYLLSLTITYGGTNFVLALYNQISLDIYCSIFIIEYFALTLLYSALNPTTRKAANTIGYVLLAVFIAIMALKLTEMVGGTNLL